MKPFATMACAMLWVAVSVSAADAAGAGNGRKVYKWLDNQGVTHYGDQVPPEYASQEQSVINAEGIETSHVEAQRSADQVAAEEQKRQAAEQRAAQDRTLLNTYGNVAEIERLRDQRLALLSDQVKVTGQFLEVLDGQMKKLRLVSMHFRPYSDDPHAPPMSDQVTEDLVRVSNDIQTQQQNLLEKRSEAAAMSKQFEDDITRFKELKGLH